MSGRFVLQFSGSTYSFSSLLGKGELLSNHSLLLQSQSTSPSKMCTKKITQQTGLGDRPLKQLTDSVAGN